MFFFVSSHWLLFKYRLQTQLLALIKRLCFVYISVSGWQTYTYGFFFVRDVTPARKTMPRGLSRLVNKPLYALFCVILFTMYVKCQMKGAIDKTINIATHSVFFDTLPRGWAMAAARKCHCQLSLWHAWVLLVGAKMGFWVEVTYQLWSIARPYP